MSEIAARDSSVYGAMASWFTPSYLFIFINLVIGTIAITSRFTTTPKRQRQHQLIRSPSLLDRFTSFNLRYHKHQTTATLKPHDVVVESVQTLDSPRPVQIGSFDTTETREGDEVKIDNSPQLDRIRSFSFRRTESERSEAVQNSDSGMNLVRTPSLLERVRRFSLELGKVEKESCDSVQQQLSRAPSFLQRLKSLTFDRTESEAEVRDGGEFVEEREEEEGVDAKADDFINRFRQQLRLQRLHSILRCRDMLTRNS
ncbi:uncharacterized protein LOC106761585 [Vigna radiata var. radiata]|uniref:Uncharacterized protein LOC106761585 n=1 Tax=Vigna radiata var. radiata TaxID=3916 RepID=A0A1S3U3P9_VIGRR|nr:uncharacterized protein LOC106761585 [Vigna radiata var. radiata]